MAFRVYSRRNKIRDVDIAIAWHNSKRTLKDVANEFGVTTERVRQIHSRVVRFVLGCIQINGYDFTEKKDHCVEVVEVLMAYRTFLTENGF